MKLSAALLAIAASASASCSNKPDAPVEKTATTDSDVRVKGIVLDDAGQPVEGASVVWFFYESDHRPSGYRPVKGSKHDGNQRWTQTLTTDSDGLFITEGLGPGLLVLGAHRTKNDRWNSVEQLGRETIELPRETEVVLSFRGLQTFEVFAEDEDGKALPATFFSEMHTKDRVYELLATRRDIELWTETPSKSDLYDGYGRSGPLRIDLFRLGRLAGEFRSPERNVEIGRLPKSFSDYTVRNRPGTLWLLADEKPIARTDYEADSSIVWLRIPQ